MEVRAGYKRTEVGVIPEAWAAPRLDSLGGGSVPPVKAGPFGSSLTKDQYVPLGFKVYGQEQVIRGDHLFGDYFISAGKYRELESCAVRPGDVLLSLVGTAGKLLEVPDDAPLGVINPRLVRFSFDRSRVLPKFFKYQFESGSIQALLSRQAQGGTMGVLNAGALRPFRIPLPPIDEQRAIAAALSAVDALLGGLDRLIAKKRDLKQAAMQQLLTGQTRLPGFQGEWEVKPLENLISSDRFAIVDGPFGSQLKVDEYVESGVPVIEMEHLCDKYINERIERCITLRKFEDLKRSAVYPGDIIISKTGSLGKLGLIPESVERGLITSRLAKITVDPAKADRRFVFQCLLKLRSDGYWEKVSQGGTMQILGIGMLKSAPLPSLSVTEQVAIATVLSDMDAELTALEARRDKTHALKQGMMQELLTGRTQLV